MESRTIIINDMPFTPIPGLKYAHNYVAIFDDVCNKDPEFPERDTWRTLILEDLWFLLYFVLKIPSANHPFVVQACKDLEKGSPSFTLDLWAREHFKTSVITVAETIQDILKNPEERICIMSYSQKASLKIFSNVKYAFENSALLKFCFPDVLYKDPQKEAWKWSDDAGLWVRRKSMAREATLEAWSLLEGMPTGSHFTKIKYDDVETADTVNSPDIMQKLKDSYHLSLNLLSDGGTIRVIGTTYHHDGLLEYLRNQKKSDGVTPVFTTRVKTATIDGTFNGPSAFLSEERLDSLRGNRRIFAAQQLLNPSSMGIQKLDPEHLVYVKPDEIPRNIIKLIIVDQAGVSKRKDREDSWAILCIGIEPHRDDIGLSNIYLVDAIIEPMPPAEGDRAIVDMYTRNGRVRAIGVEKVALSSTEIHVSNALRAKGRHLTVENSGIILLRPGGRKKEERIESNLQWPLMNGKIHISTRIPEAYRARIKMEMQKFPMWHDDALDGLSYFYDAIKDFRFGPYQAPQEEDADIWARRKKSQPTRNGWMIV